MSPRSCITISISLCPQTPWHFVFLRTPSTPNIDPNSIPVYPFWRLFLRLFPLNAGFDSDLLAIDCFSPSLVCILCSFTVRLFVTAILLRPNLHDKTYYTWVLLACHGVHHYQCILLLSILRASSTMGVEQVHGPIRDKARRNRTRPSDPS